MDWALVAGSLAAVLLLAGIAWALGLGGSAAINDEDAAKRIAEEALAGFEALDATLCTTRAAALVFGADGTVAAIRTSGARFLVRALRTPRWRLWDAGEEGGLEVDTGDPHRLRLHLPGDRAAALGRRLDAAIDNGVNNAGA